MSGLNAIDSFYLTGVTLSTVGYGDIVPVTPVTATASLVKLPHERKLRHELQTMTLCSIVCYLFSRRLLT